MQKDYLEGRDAVAWLVMGPDPALATCLRCGLVHEPPKLAVDFAALGAYINGLAALHSKCAPLEGEEAAAERDDWPPADRSFEDDTPQPVTAPKPARSIARKLANGSVWFDCREHGTKSASITGGGEKRKASCGVQGCTESVPYSEVRPSND